ncbi:SDR family NAD(P)-dependent oxidoreductase [Streptomyces sp. NPDC048425]|uniref:SDR family NAD(P)-dependent oxidoreductase n=1 Tax=Streptomyces sp. NPDC048425 TaxID=3365548 RepID=UPI003721A0D3
MTTFENDVAVVTGAAGGIGVGICRALLDAGARVALADVDADGLDRAVEELGDARAVPFVVDLGDDEQTAGLPERVRDHFGGLDVLVNNAGIRQVTEIADLTPSEWRRTLDINLVAPFVLIRAVLPGMVEQGRGKIVNIASLAGLTAVRGRAAYGAAKAGLIMLTRSVAIEFGSRGIWCNAVAPGVVETPMTSSFFQDPAVTESLVQVTPVGRWGRPKDIAAPVIFLAGRASDFINGVTVPADGGWTAGYHAVGV